jgi:protein-glucosylgalactosylhydroxylysine glucosidase
MFFNRRDFLSLAGAGAANMIRPESPFPRSESIDRRSLVRRHNPVVTAADPFSALSIGNGEIAFTADFTGLQTFPSLYEKEFPLCTASHWGWHTEPIPAGLRRDDLRYSNYDTYGRAVGYATDAKGQEPLFNWLRQNPHRLHLGRIGFSLTRTDGAAAEPADLKKARQILDLWTGILSSRFEFEGQPVEVETCCHPDLDLIAVQIRSPLIAAGRLRVMLAFPYGSPEVPMADWTRPERHQTRFEPLASGRARFSRQLDADSYCVSLGWTERQVLERKSEHVFQLAGTGGHSLGFACLFSPQPFQGVIPSVAHTQSASRQHWERFWRQGGAIDLSSSKDSRAQELERRMVLSQYLTALHCAGSLPSQETGLLFNSWYGKFHLEMHWWHSTHFTAWNRFPLFEKSLPIYARILPVARELARRQGYLGARWPKMIGPDGHDSPSPVGPLLIWQQPHPIYYAELCYRHKPDRETLLRWQEVVSASAEFMASFAVYDRPRDRYVLGPPLKTVSENQEPRTTINPAFELAYWRFGLSVAQNWRERLGQKRDPQWNEILSKLAPLPVQDGLYLMQEGLADTYTQWNWEHPALVGAYGVQRGDGVDPVIMRRSVRRLMECWQWDRCWGWDFPMAAMAAARVGEPELAIDALMLEVPKNRYLPNGHNYQRPNLTAYLPGNGGLLAALAMMAAGWTGGPTSHAPGFPSNGRWFVRHEGLRPWL